MGYSQKYCLVSFIEPVAPDMQFAMADWPLHLTVADVFAVDQNIIDIAFEFGKLLAKQSPIYTFARNDATLGKTEVVLLDKPPGLIDLHITIVDFLERNGAVFNNPEFTRHGFLPHCTIQKTKRLHAGERVPIDTIALIDMFPSNDWRQRKILQVFPLQSAAR